MKIEVPPQRRSVRLAGYDYGQVGAYYITLCTHGRACLLGDIVDGEAHLSAIGQVVNEEWAYVELLRPRVKLDEYVLMPNHMHAVVVIMDHGTPRTRPSSQTIGSIVRGFKAATTGRLRAVTQRPTLIVWQRNYYEHVVRNDADLRRIRAYIADNPARWAEDEDNPARMSQGGS